MVTLFIGLMIPAGADPEIKDFHNEVNIMSLQEVIKRPLKDVYSYIY